MVNSLNPAAQTGFNSSFFQVGSNQGPQSYWSRGNQTNQCNQGISEKQLDQLLTQLIIALLQQSNNAQQAGQSNGSPSQYTQMLMNIVGDILQARNGGGFGGGAGGDFGGGLGVSLASDTGSMQ